MAVSSRRQVLSVMKSTEQNEERDVERGGNEAIA